MSRELTNKKAHNQADYSISEVTRRNITDNLRVLGVDWAGRLSETDFLSRIYDLEALPSTDRRHAYSANALADIFQHRENNRDWDDYWVFADGRLELDDSDEAFLRFLCEMVHPVVRPDDVKVRELLKLFNDHLGNDGWEIYEASFISARPVFQARRKTAGFAVTEQIKVPSEKVAVADGDRQTASLPEAVERDPQPTCFISYSWDSEQHKDWVRRFATELTRRGVRTRLDQWNVRLGMDLPQYMETSIRESDFVLLICTPTFAEKANNVKGGVGYEKTIVTGEIYQGATPFKFVPILRSGMPDAALPSYLKSKAYEDFREDSQFQKALESVLRHFFDEPEHTEPELGKKPSFAAIPSEPEVSTAIRHAFAMSESVVQRIRAFRDERIGKILAGETPVPIRRGAAVVVHFIPLGAFTENKTIGIDVLNSASKELVTLPAPRSGCFKRNNLDGVLIYSVSGRKCEDGSAVYSPDSKPESSCVQLYRNGVIETVDGVLFRAMVERYNNKFILPGFFEKCLITHCNQIRVVIQQLGIGSPTVVFLSLLNVRGFTIQTESVFGSDLDPIDRQHLILPESLIETLDAPADAFLRPAFDLIWQASGGTKCPHYDTDGKWVGQQ